MTKEEFIEQLEDTLVGEVSNAVVYDNKQYYQRYIFREVKNGRSEKEVIDGLGDPRLIARTIIDMENIENKNYNPNVSFTEDIDNTKQKFGNIYLGKLNLNTWYGKLIASVIGIFMLLLVIWVIAGIVSMLFSIVTPVLSIIFIVWAVRKIIKTK
jgi:uncharacterized membrane protein